MKRILKVTGIIAGIIILILVFMLLFPFLFREKFAAIVKNTARKSLKTEMNFSSMKVSFFHHFPKLTLTLTDFYLLSSPPFEKDTLISAKDISFGVDLMSVFRGPVRVSGVYIDRGRVVMKYNEKGKENFDVITASSDTSRTDTSTTASSANLKIESISFRRTDFVYADYSIPMRMTVRGINYKGKSEISNDILNLTSTIKIDSVNFSYNNVDYLKSKPVSAELETIIDLKSLNIKFDKNDFVIKDVPFEFRGELNFSKSGYGLFLSLYSMYHDEWVSGSVDLISTDKLWVSVKTDINMRLENWTSRLGIKDVELKGLFALKLKALGNYITGPDPASPKHDTVILSIPDFTLTSTLSNGYVKLKDLPAAADHISFVMNAASKDHDYRKINLQLENFKALFLNNKIEGYCKIAELKDLPVDCRITSAVNLADISKVIPLDSLDLQGILDMDVTVRGRYAPEKKLFPFTHARVNLKDGRILTKYYSHPLENINLQSTITNDNGLVSGTRVKVDELSFLFLGNPFTLKADLKNPDNLDYDITSRGSVDIAGIYKMFSQKGMELSGFITTDLHLRGRQSDAMAGRIDRLDNKGTLGLRNIAFRADYLPHELILRSGQFRFDNDKIWFEKFDSRCGKSSILLDGHLENVVNYVLAEKQVLKGALNFRSDFVDVADFMAPSAPATESTPASSSPGVVIIPAEYDLSVKADLKKVVYDKNVLQDLKADVRVDSGICVLKNMQFAMIGCNVKVDASYASTNPKKALFDFHVSAENFDVQRAYREVEMFRNLASSAEKCEGIISIDYSIKGKLINDMEPVYPSLEGGGVITISKVKVMGLKLFNEMSKNLGREKLKDPDLTKIELKTTIKNNIITLEQTKMKISSFRLKISGESSFDGKLNLKTRVGLPPLGLIGIPIRIMGTMDAPKFKYGRGSNDEQLKETDYSDEIPAEYLDKLKNVKEEEDNGND